MSRQRMLPGSSGFLHISRHLFDIVTARHTSPTPFYEYVRTTVVLPRAEDEAHLRHSYEGVSRHVFVNGLLPAKLPLRYMPDH